MPFMYVRTLLRTMTTLADDVWAIIRISILSVGCQNMRVPASPAKTRQDSFISRGAKLNNNHDLNDLISVIYSSLDF